MPEPDVTNLMTVAQAVAVIDGVELPPPRIDRGVAVEKSLGRTLAQRVEADRDYPPFDRSLMDGFAVRTTDLRGGRVNLRVVDELAAGDWPTRGVEPGTCATIFTGAPLPPGADGVIPVESLVSREGGCVVLEGSDDAARFVTLRGADCPAGATVLPRGGKVTAAALAIAASVGAGKLDLFARPRVAVLSTGNEIVPADAEPGPAQIRNSNSSMLCGLLKRFECEPRDVGLVRDDPRLIRTEIEAALPDADVLMISGGMSMGDYDFVPRVLVALGAELKITRLKIKPGKPFVFARLGEKFVFGLPGNPVAGFVCTIRLCSRLFARLAGRAAGDVERWRCGELSSALPSNGPREFYQPAWLDSAGCVTPLAWKGSADVFTLNAANTLLVRPENGAALPAGSTVRGLEIPE